MQTEFNKIAIFKKHVGHGGFMTPELLTVKDNYEKLLDDLNILDGNLLYVELINDTTKTIENYEFKWIAEFQNDMYRIKIRFNSPLVEIPFESTGTLSEFPN